MYPVVLTRVFTAIDSYECYTFGPHSDCSGSDWAYDFDAVKTKSASHSVVIEHAECMEAGDYDLILTNAVAQSWKKNSYLTLTALSQSYEDAEPFKGYIMGDFAYNAIYMEDSTVARSNTVKVHVGPITCAEKEQVLILQKFSGESSDAHSTRLEGFSLEKINAEGTETLHTFTAAAAFVGLPFVPQYKTFLCLSQGEHRLRLHSYASDLESSCSAWSTLGNKSFMSLKLLSLSSYANGELTDAEVVGTIEGENFAVFGAGRTHEDSPYIVEEENCSLDLVFSTAAPIFDEVVIAPLEKTVAVEYNAVSTFTITSPVNTKFTFTCFKGEEEVSCGDHGLTFRTMTTYRRRLADSATGKNIKVSISNSEGWGDQIELHISASYAGHCNLISGACSHEYQPLTIQFADAPHLHQPMSRRLAEDPTEPPTQAPTILSDTYFSLQEGNITLPETDVHDFGCTLDGVPVPEDLIEYNEEEGIYIIHASSYDPLNCTISTYNFTLYSQPTCDDPSLPLHTSIPKHETLYEEECVDPTKDVSIERYCVYNPAAFKAEIVEFVTVCHRTVMQSEVEVPPAGHGYTIVDLNILFTSREEDEYNIAPSAAWFKQDFTYVMSEYSEVPIKDVFVSNIQHDVNDKNSVISVAFDIAYEDVRNFLEQFTEEGPDSYLEKVNAALRQSYPSYWSTHSLSNNNAGEDYKISPNYCPQANNYDVEYNYIDPATHETKTASFNPVFTPTIYWYTASWTPNPSDIDFAFTGAITRYCKVIYYHAEFDEPRANDMAQILDYPWFDVHFQVKINNMDPRNSNYEIKYALSRALNRLIADYQDTNDISIYDINVHSITGDQARGDENAQPGDEDYQLFYNTIFNVQVRVASQEQADRVRAFINEQNDENNENRDEVSYMLLNAMRNTLGEGFRTQSRSVEFILVY